MAPDVKFCGLTRPEDAAVARSIGAAYLGVVFAPSPRRVDPETARRVLDGAGDGPRRVGVFATRVAEEIGEVASAARLDVVQLHGDPTVSTIREVRARFEGEVWAVIRVAGDALPDGWEALAEDADAIVLDARPRERPTLLGGTGETFDWRAVADRLRPVRPRTRLVVAGGLRAENVGEAIVVLAPDVVDVSSGVESAPGRKDHARMRAFIAAVSLGSRGSGEG